MNNYDEQIRAIEDQIEELEDKKRELMKNNRKYYIGMQYYGICDDFSIELTPIGYCSEYDAKKWADRNESDEETYMETEYFDVPKSKYHAYVLISRLNKALYSMEDASRADMAFYGSDKIDESYKKTIEFINNEISRAYELGEIKLGRHEHISSY